MKRSRAAAGILIALALALAPALAEARGGAKGSFGSRGARTFQTAPATPTAPQARPVERSMTQPGQNAAQPGVANAARPGAAGSFAQRNPFMTGLLGGFLGAGLFGLLFGGGLFGAGFGGAAMLGLLLQIALIGGLAYLAFRLWRGRQAASQPAYAYAGRGTQLSEPQLDAPLARSGALAGGAAPDAAQGPTVGDEIGVGPQDYEAFERVLTEVQAAWGGGDLAALKANLTPEMLSYFSEELTSLASQGLENRVEDVKLEQGDLSEAWREGGRDYATVAMHWSARDWTERAGGGEVVEGDREARSEATEVWTFVRAAGGRWLLSAIQQV